VIIPKRLGKFKIHLMDFSSGTKGQPKPMKTYEVQVKPV